jgi:hypothetical protein
MTVINAIELALIAWGDEYRMHSGSALRCPLGSAIANKGVMIVGTAETGGKALYTGELGVVGAAVESALVAVRQDVECGGLGAAGVELIKLARVRYLTDPMPIVSRQMKRMGWKAEATYYNKLDQLHRAIEPNLLVELPWLKRAG